MLKNNLDAVVDFYGESCEVKKGKPEIGVCALSFVVPIYFFAFWIDLKLLLYLQFYNSLVNIPQEIPQPLTQLQNLTYDFQRI